MHGDKCARIHNKPMISNTIVFKHLYQNPPAAIAFSEGSKISDEDLKEALRHFEKFYEEIFIELSNFGEIKELCIADNLGDHLIGNVYVRFNDEVAASKAFKGLAGKYYHSTLVDEEYCPLTKISDGKCKKNEQGVCKRGSMCNFLHLKKVNKSLIKSLKDEMYENHPEYKNNRNNRFKKRRKHQNSSSESSLDRYDNNKRKKILEKWNADYQIEKKKENRRRKEAQARIDLAILERKLMGKKFHEDDRTHYRKQYTKPERYEDSDDETISNY